MGHTKIKSVTFKDDKVFLICADSSLRPLTWNKFESEILTKIYQAEGKRAVYIRLAKDYFIGTAQFYQGSKISNCFKKAYEEILTDEFHWSNFFDKYAAEFIADVVIRLENNFSLDRTDFSEELNHLRTLRNNKDYLIEAVQISGHNYQEFATDKKVKYDKNLAYTLLTLAKNKVWFKYPEFLKDDKEFAIKALKYNGCFYRELSDKLKENKGIILLAFDKYYNLPDTDNEKRKYFEHLPDLIPASVFINKNGNVDEEFICELIEICPSLHMSRAPYLITISRKAALTWCRVGEFFDKSLLLPEYLIDEEIKNVLFERGFC